MDFIKNTIQQQNNTMNNQLLQMYNRGQKNVMSAGPVQDSNELIDISSDDSSEVPNVLSENKNSNGSAAAGTQTVPTPLIALPQLEASTPSDKKTVITRFQSSNSNALESPERGRKRKLETSFSGSSGKRKKDIPAQVPSVSFKDVGGVTEVLKDVCKLLLHVKHPEIYRQIGIAPPRGFLLHGPPGCGKTLLANAIAGVSFFALIFYSWNSPTTRMIYKQ